MPRESFTVYVVDDDESIRRALKRLLRSAGYHAVTFNSAEEFMEATYWRGEGCLVLDIRLPGMTGLDLQEKLVSLGAKYPVIFMTAHDNPQWRERANKAGAVAYLRKPFDEESLLDAIHLAGGEEQG
jgi:FixJ family two-component response regulator